jgi:DNA-binding NtrC family response regulator
VAAEGIAGAKNELSLYEQACLAALTGLLANPNRITNDHVAQTACDHADRLVSEIHLRTMQQRHLARSIGTEHSAERIAFGPPMTMRQIRSRAIQEALDRRNGDKTAAAKDLGVSLKTLYNWINDDRDAPGLRCVGGDSA